MKRLIEELPVFDQVTRETDEPWLKLIDRTDHFSGVTCVSLMVKVGEVNEPHGPFALPLHMTDAQMRRFDEARIDADRGRQGERAQLEKSAPG
jgi:hypothetical protein